MSEETQTRGWIRFTPGTTYPPAADVVELTDEQAHELRMFDFGLLTSVMGELVHFTVIEGRSETHYVLGRPSTSAGRAERDQILARNGLAVPLHAINPECWRSRVLPITRCGLSRGAGVLMTSVPEGVTCAGCRAAVAEEAARLTALGVSR